MKAQIVLAMLSVAVLFIGGCTEGEQASTSGMIMEQNPVAVGRIAPEVSYQNPDGTMSYISEMSEPISILVFTETASNECCTIQPQIAKLAERFQYEPITVIQVSLPAGDPGMHECQKAEHSEKHIMALCDVNRVAWEAYNEPAPNTMFLLDQTNQIAMIDSLDNFDMVARSARKLSDNLIAEQEEMYEY